MGYRPIGALAWKAAEGLGYEGRSLWILQALSAVAGALAVSFAFVAFRRLSGGSRPAAGGAFFLATTSYFWASCVDAFYIAPAAAFAAAAMAVVANRRPSVGSALTASILTAAAVLVWQANIILVLPFAVGFLARSDRVDLRRRLTCAVTYVVATIAVTGLAYLLVGVVVSHRRSVSSVIDWISNYSGARLPQWGTWEASRFQVAVNSAFESLVPLRSVGGLTGITGRGFTLESVVVAAGLVALLVLFGLAIWVVWSFATPRSWLSTFGWLAIGYLSFMPFIVWWDPFEPKWFVVPNLFLAGLVAGALGLPGVGRAVRSVAFTCIGVVALSTLVVVIWPQHTTESARQRRAACVAEHMERRDVFIATDWKWNAYLTYFYDVRIVSTIGLAPRMADPDRLIEAIRAEVAGVHAAGASAYMVDPSHYSSGYLRWLESQTGLTGSMLESLGGEQAFVCDGVALLRLEDRR
jgi:hypothetical protein